MPNNNYKNLISDYKFKKDFITHFSESFDYFKNTHTPYFITLTFQDTHSLANASQKKTGRDEFKRYFNILYSEIADRTQKGQRHNKFLKPTMIFIPEESLKLKKKIKSEKSDLKIVKRQNNGTFNTHYHGVVFIHNSISKIFKEIFFKKKLARDKKTEKIIRRFEIKPESIHKGIDFLYSTDVRPCRGINGAKEAFEYSCKHFLKKNKENENFDLDDVFLYTPGLTDIQQIINRYMTHDTKPFIQFLQSRSFTQIDLCEFLVSLKDIHPFFDKDRAVYKATEILKGTERKRIIELRDLIDLQTRLLTFIKNTAINNINKNINTLMPYIAENQVLQSTLSLIGTLIKVQPFTENSFKGGCYVRREIIQEAHSN